MKEGAQEALCLVRKCDSRSDESWPRGGRYRREPFNETGKFFVLETETGQTWDSSPESQSHWGPFCSAHPPFSWTSPHHLPPSPMSEVQVNRDFSYHKQPSRSGTRNQRTRMSRVMLFYHVKSSRGKKHQWSPTLFCYFSPSLAFHHSKIPRFTVS